MNKLVIFGTQNFAKLVHYAFTREGDYEVSGFTVHRRFITESTFLGLPVVPFEEIDQTFPPSEYEIFLAVGIGNVNRLRENCFHEILKRGYRMAHFVSPKASVPKDLEVKANTMIMDFACIGPEATLGHNVILWPQTTLGAMTHVAPHCWLAGPYIGESSVIAENTFVGVNATISPNVKVGRYNIIGAGTVVLKNTKDHQVTKSGAAKVSRALSSKFSKILD